MTTSPRLCWRPDLHVTHTSDADGPCVHVEDLRSRQFFRIGAAEFALLSRFDGRRPWQEVVSDAHQSLDHQAFSEAEVQAILQWAMQRRLLISEVTGDSSSEIKDRPTAGSKWNLLSIRVPLGCPDKLCEKLLPWIGWLFGPAAFAVWLVVVGLAISEVFVNWDRFQAASAEVFVPANWLGLGLAWLFLKVIHEAAHALVCKRHGGEVREVGIALILFAPVAFVDVTSCWRFASRWPRIHTALAGIYVEMACAALAVLIASQTASLEMQSFLDNVAVMASLTTLLFNINPLSRFDGYFVLADLCRVHNLYARGRLAARQLLGRWFVGSAGNSHPTSGFLAAYGMATWLWSLSVMFGLIIAASMYWHGAGLILSAILVLLWFGPAFQQGVRSVTRWTSCERRQFAFRAGLLSVGAVLLLALAPWPFGLTAPGVVEYSPLSVVRADGAGFVERVLVQEGDVVSEGQPLLELRNEVLERDLRDLEFAIQQSQLRERLAVEQRDTSTSQIEQQQRDALQRRLAERQRQVERLVIHAPSDGVIIGRELAALVGSFVSEGQELLSLGDPTRREFVAAIRQEDLPFAQAQLRLPVSIRLRGRGDVVGELRRVRPRASTLAEHHCLCAPFGGPLSVQTRSDEQNGKQSGGFELLEPHFWITASLGESTRNAPLAGETGLLWLGHRRTCGQELMNWLSRWFDKLDREPRTSQSLSVLRN